VEATAIMKTSKKQEAAKALADWAVTPDANKLYAANFAVLALPEAQEKHEFIPADLEKRLARTTSTGQRPIAIAFFPNGAAATKPRRRRSNTPEALRLGGAAPSPLWRCAPEDDTSAAGRPLRGVSGGRAGIAR
jgi:hypothetical protein